jgi:hypothetical protein
MTAADLTPSRAAFEQYWRSTRTQRRHRERLELGLREDGTYVDSSVQRHWWTWQWAERFVLGAACRPHHQARGFAPFPSHKEQ